MIDESLLKSGAIGRDGFSWWIGRVAHPKYWKNANVALSQDSKIAQRCKVRIIGYHPWDNSLREEELPWAHVLMDPITGSGQGGLGDTMCLAGGETCIGFFLDGEEAQQPVILGLLHKHAEVRNIIEENDLFEEGTSGFKPFTGVPGGKVTATKRATVLTESVSKKSPAITGKIKQLTDIATDVGDSIQGSLDKTASAYFPKGRSSSAADALEKDTTKSWMPPSLCGDDAIGQMTQSIQDFITFTNGLESALGEFIDPITNKLIDMRYKIQSMSKQIAGIIKGVINNLRDGLISKVLSLFKIFSALQKKINPADFFLGPLASKATKKILALLYCVFGNVMGKLEDFLANMLGNLVGNTVNAPFCAAQQFVSGILAKAMDLIEDITGPILKGIDWLTGGLSNIKGVLSKVSNLARKIFSFIDCDALKCDKPSEWVSSRNSALKVKADKWQETLDKVDVFKGIQKKLDKVDDYMDENKLAKAIAGGDLDTVKDDEVYGVSVLTIIKGVQKLAGKDATKLKNGGLGSLESGLSLMSLFGTMSIEFDECNKKTSTPTNQDDIISMPPGFTYDKCIPPKAEVNGKGVGAELEATVGVGGRVFSVEVLNGGFGYDKETSVAIIDKTNYGSGAQAKPIVSDGIGSITSVVVTSTGSGYCGGGAVGVITGIIPVNPGVGYTPGDQIIIENGRSDPPDDDKVDIKDHTTGYWLPGPDGTLGDNHWDINGNFGDGLPPTGDDDIWISFTGKGNGGTGTGTTTIDDIRLTPNGSFTGVISIPSDFNYEFTGTPTIRINTNTGFGAEFVPLMSETNQSRVDDSVKPLVGITSVIDCV